MKLLDFHTSLIEDLKDTEFALFYLQDAVEEGDPDSFRLALRNVIEAHGGIGKVSAKTNLHRVSLYKALSENGNPLFSSVLDILNAVGIGLKPYLKDEAAFLGEKE